MRLLAELFSPGGSIARLGRERDKAMVRATVEDLGNEVTPWEMAVHITDKVGGRPGMKSRLAPRLLFAADALNEEGTLTKSYKRRPQDSLPRNVYGLAKYEPPRA